MSMERGRFITVEGIDGAGKTTAVGYLAERLRDAGIEAVTTREPGGTELAEAIRDLLKGTDGETPNEDTETLLMFAARAQHLAVTVWPALEAGKWVICDRFTDATYAYQGGGRGIPADRIRVLEEWVGASAPPRNHLDRRNGAGVGASAPPRDDLDRRNGAGLHPGFQPDRTLLFDLPPEEGLRRRAGEGRGSDRFEQEGLNFLEGVQAAYRERAEADPDRFCVIDADREWRDVAAALDAWLAREIQQWRGHS